MAAIALLSRHVDKPPSCELNAVAASLSIDPAHHLGQNNGGSFEY